MITGDLLRAYHETTYRAFIQREAVDIRIGVLHERLDVLLGGASWAFMSAANPASRIARDNRARHQKLIERLEGLGYAMYPGVGIPDGGDWIPEESMLVPEMTAIEAIRIGREFGQNAIVTGIAGDAALLVCCVDP